MVSSKRVCVFGLFGILVCLTPIHAQEMELLKPIHEVSIDIRHKTGPGQQGAKIPEDQSELVFGSMQQAPTSSLERTRQWYVSRYEWQTPCLFHRPLYFEQVNLERYGHYRRSWHVESAISVAHFFATIPTLPYRLGATPPCERVYTLGHFRPGSYNPHFRHRTSFSFRGSFWQGIATSGLLFAL